MERLVRSAVKDVHQEESKKLSLSFHHLSTENQVLHYENQGLREALLIKKKHKSKGKVLNLQQRQEYHGGGVLYSPRKVREGKMRRRVNERPQAEEKLAKARAKNEKEERYLQRQLEAEERRMERERLEVLGRRRRLTRRLNVNARRRRETLQGLYNYPKRGKGEPHQHHQSANARDVWVMPHRIIKLWVHRLLHRPRSQHEAATSTSQRNLDSTN
jgi:hypothetical protein